MVSIGKKIGKGHTELVQRIQRLLKTESLMGAVVLLKSLSPVTASQVLEALRVEDQKKLYDVWLGSGETLLTELPVKETAKNEPSEKRPLDLVPFFPNHFISDVTAVLWVICLISLLTIFAPAELETKANPFNTPTGVKPEWYFLFLYGLLRFFPPIVSILIPLVGGILLTLLPFLDKNPDTRPAKRKLALITSTFLLMALIAFSLIGALGK